MTSVEGFMEQTHEGRQAKGSAEAVLEVEGLHLTVGGSIPLVDDLGLTVKAGEIVALVGESGSGKSITALSIMRLLPEGIAASAGRVKICGEDMLSASPAQLNRIRGNKVGMIFQQPRAMLDPTCKVGPQVTEAMRSHLGIGRRAAWSKAISLLRDVGIPEPEERLRSYAHQLSGGLAQRVMIAAALSGNPDLLIADEPTTALDVTVQAQILQLLDSQRKERNLSILLITHDLSVVAALADQVAVIYAGRILEVGPAATVLREPKHPYTESLIRSSLLKVDGRGDLYSIPGSAPRPFEHEGGCRFHGRCATAASCGIDDLCAAQEPDMVPCAEVHEVRCWATAPGTDPMSGS
jgi:peptide/nickel transport system ATP-binding protein